MPSRATYWVDRALGRSIVLKALRDASVLVTTYFELYPDDPAVPDVRWIPEVTALGWVILTKDKNIRRSPVEIAALRQARARYVCLSSGNMRGDEQAACLVHHWKTFDGVVAARTAPVIVSVTREAVHWLDEDVWRAVKHKR